MGCGAVHGTENLNEPHNPKSYPQRMEYESSGNNQPLQNVQSIVYKKFSKKKAELSTNKAQLGTFHQRSNLIKTNNNDITRSFSETVKKSYQVAELIGRGSYGQVYRCIETSTGGQFALKIVKLNAKNKKQAAHQISNLKSEISVLKKLNHPNIVKYYTFDVSPDSQTVQIIFQLVKQGTLSDYLSKNGPLSQKQASVISKGILNGLQYLHDHSIIHRDLKCANILMGKGLVPKITDFGTAKEVKVVTNEDIAKVCASLKGTPYYMAPQILKRVGHFKSADVWSFGCTLIEMLTGRPPWTTLTNNFQEIISYIVAGIHPPFPPKISKECQFMLESCFESAPSQRLTVKQLLKHRFIVKGEILQKTLAVQKQNRKIQSNKWEQQQKKKLLHLQGEKSKENQEQISFCQELCSKAFNTQDRNVNKNSKRQGYEKEQNNGKCPRKKPVTSKAQKKAAKTAGQLKMTQQNILQWSQIELNNAQLVVNAKNPRIKIQKPSQKQLGKEPIIKRYLQNLDLKNEKEASGHIIDTALAREEREKELQRRLKGEARKKAERQRWEEELRREKQFLKKQLVHSRFQV